MPADTSPLPGAGEEVEMAQADGGVVRMKRLEQGQLEGIYGRLPELAAEADDSANFQKRASTKPMPRTGETIEASFPPSAGHHLPDAAPTGVLEVLRFQPEGEVARPAQVSVTFSQPMVALSGHEDSVIDGVPVVINPSPPGNWRWVGTQTLLFDPSTPFAMATDYVIEVAKGTTTALGISLEQGFKAAFATPPVGLTQLYPQGGPHPVNPVIFLGFDQRIDREALIKHIEVSSPGGRHAVRLATPDEIQADDAIRSLANPLTAETWIAVRTTKAFPMASEISVKLTRGAPSAEGPRRSERDQVYTFQTHGPLTLVNASCGWGGECLPSMGFRLAFSNPLAPAGELTDFIKVSPAIAEMTINNYGNGDYVQIEGKTLARTTYTVTISPTLTDRFGQKLGTRQVKQFTMSGARESLSIGNKRMVVLDPAAKPVFSMFSVNHAQVGVRLYRVVPTDWRAFVDGASGDATQTMPGTRISDRVVTVQGESDRLNETAIDLSPALGKGGLGHVILEVVALSAAEHEHRPLRVWVQSTRIGLDAMVDPSGFGVWASSLGDGKPLGGVEVSFGGGKVRATTAANGMAKVLSMNNSGEGGYLVGKRGDDTAILLQNNDTYSVGDSWTTHGYSDAVRWLVIDDRQMYKPGETVRIKGWARVFEGGLGGALGIPEAGNNIFYEVYDPRGNSMTSGHTKTNALGGFDLSFALAEGTNLGGAYVNLQLTDTELSGETHYHHFQIQEFRRPEFEVTAQGDAGPHFAGGEAGAVVKAAYYAGGALSEATTHWTVTQSPGNFAPPNRGDFVFGVWQPWWIHHREYFDQQTSGHSGTTGADGQHRVTFALRTMVPPRPVVVTATASVADVNRQAWEAAAHLLVHPASEYVGLRSKRLFVERGQPLELEAIVSDLEGVLVAGRTITIQATRISWRTGNSADPQVCTVVSKAEAVKCSFKTEEGGEYQIVAAIEDAKGRGNQTQVTRWVSGGLQPPSRTLVQEDVTLIPDGQEYAIGDVAEILIQAPFFPSEGVVTLSRQGVISQQRITLDGSSHTLRIPLLEAYLPNVHVWVELNGASTRLDANGELDASLPKRPAFASGEITLSMSKSTRTLALEVVPVKAFTAPGTLAEVDVLVRDSAGKPVANSEVLLFAVDEAVLALSSYQLKDPIAIFYAHRDAVISSHRSRENILLVNPDDADALAQPDESGVEDESRPRPSKVASRMKKESDDSGGSQPSIALRQNFDALAAFEPTLRTDAKGRVRVTFKLPDNLTRYRVMAVAVSGAHHFGAGESQITARLPLMVRPSPPRFLNFGDQFELPVVLQNQTDEPMQVQVGIRGTNVRFDRLPGYALTLGANERVEVRFAATTVKAGRARFQVGASAQGGAVSDAAYFDLPVWTPATTEAFATYGTIDDGAVFQAVKMPEGVFEEFGGLELTTSSTELQALTDAFIYLSNYPYDCAEQISSRILAIAALRDVLSAFQAEGMPSLEAIEASMKRDIERLGGMQNGDGGFGFWKRGEQSWPYTSLHVAHALNRAKKKGYAVPAEMLERADAYLVAIEKSIPPMYGEHAKYALMAYALYVRDVGGKRDLAGAKALFKRAGLGKLSLEAVGWLLSVFAQDASVASERDAIRKHLNNRVQETAATAQFASDYGDSNYLMLSTSRRTDGVILEALIAAEPKSDLVPKLVRGLMGHRQKGQWGSTQDNVFVLLALDRYFSVFEKQTPNFVARAWLGEQFVGEHAFKGRSTERHHIDVPMAYLAKADKAAQSFALQKDGTGRLYYRLAMRYAPTNLVLESANHGFGVVRAYEPVDADDDVKRRDDGSWEVRAGARVKVVLTMSVPARRYHVALVDSLPAGFEPLNAALATTSLPPEANSGASKYGRHWWRGVWYEHQNMRDERVEAFTSLLWGGVYTYSFYARATTPGVFNAPPARAEEMYHPETFGRSGSDRVVVK
ncbi:MAG: hypothetical protein H0U74_13440 [Bradymonadaceae bacterium]|nr:hypothetical protein [Lujinxingiaceae bacterium]